MDSEVVTGIVILKRDYQDNDALVTIIQSTGEKLTFRAKGIMRLTSKNAASCQVFCQGEYTFILSNSNYKTLKTGKLLKARAGYFDCYASSICAMIIAEIVDKMTFDNRIDERLYMILDVSLDALEIPDLAPAVVLILTIIKLLSVDGHQFIDDGCCCCGSRRNLESIDLGQGGLICQDCRPIGRPRFSKDFLSCFYRFLHADYHNLSFLEIPDVFASLLLNLLIEHLDVDCGIVLDSAAYVGSIFS